MSAPMPRRTVALRFEGGLGDHVLAMRVLPFVRERHPDHDIIVYSDSGGHRTPARVTEMSPYVAKVVPIRTEGHGRSLADVRPEDLRLMQSSDLFIDVWGETMFMHAAVALGVSVFRILAHYPELVVPAEASEAAADHVRRYSNCVLVGLNLSTYGAALLRNYSKCILGLLERLLSESNVVILNIFTASYAFPHWPEPQRSVRQGFSLDDGELLKSLSALSDRVVPCVDLPISVVAALLSRCKYFIGVDNGSKHLAGGLGVPLTYFHPARQGIRHTLRWMPDLHRMLLFDCSDAELAIHIDTAVATVRAESNGIAGA